MANTKTSALTALTAPATTDGVPIVDDYGGSPELKIITLANMLKVINSLTADTGPDNTADYLVTWDNSASAVKKVLPRYVGAMVLHAEFGVAASPADSTTYYFGSSYALAVAAGAPTVRRIYIPRTGTIVSAYGYFSASSPGSAENNTLAIRLNDTTDTTITSTMQLNASFATFNNTALAIAVTAGDYIEIKWTAPAYATNPTGVYGVVEMLLV